MACPIRIHPLRKPPNHQPPIPRWHLTLPPDIDHVYISYIGISQHDTSSALTQAKQHLIREIQNWVASTSAVSESFTTLPTSSSHDTQEESTTTIWACYWTDTTKHTSALSTLN